MRGLTATLGNLGTAVVENIRGGSAGTGPGASLRLVPAKPRIQPGELARCERLGAGIGRVAFVPRSGYPVLKDLGDGDLTGEGFAPCFVEHD
jgi:hypothetical protein